MHRLSAISCVKTAQSIEMTFGMWTRVHPSCIRWSAHWRHLANTINSSCAAAMQPFYGHPTGQAILLLSCGFYVLSSFFPHLFSVVGDRSDVNHTSTHDVALVQI